MPVRGAPAVVRSRILPLVACQRCCARSDSCIQPLVAFQSCTDCCAHPYLATRILPLVACQRCTNGRAATVQTTPAHARPMSQDTGAHNSWCSSGLQQVAGHSCPSAHNISAKQQEAGYDCAQQLAQDPSALTSPSGRARRTATAAAATLSHKSHINHNTNMSYSRQGSDGSRTSSRGTGNCSSSKEEPARTGASTNVAICSHFRACCLSRSSEGLSAIFKKG